MKWEDSAARTKPCYNVSPEIAQHSYIHNSCSPENATVTVKSASDNKVASQEFNGRLVGMEPPHPHSLSVGNLNSLTPPKSTLFLWWLVFGGGRCVSWEGCGNGYQRGDGCLEEVQLRKKEKKTIWSSAAEPLTRGNPWHSLTDLAADGQQRVQNHNGRNGSHGDHLGVVMDDRPEGQHQHWAGDQDGDHDQRPVQPLKGNDPKHLQSKETTNEGFGHSELGYLTSVLTHLPRWGCR